MVEYTPNPGFKGVDTFTYVAEDGRGGSDTATVTVTVGNAPPQATGPTTGARPGATVTIGTLLAGASDPNIGYPGVTETLSVSGGASGTDLVLRDSNGDPIVGATVELVAGELVVSVPTDFVGEARVSYLVCDSNTGVPNPAGTLAPDGSSGEGTTGNACVRTEATVLVTNNPPVAVGDALTVQAWTRGDPAVSGNLLDGTLSAGSPDSDPDGDDIVSVTCTQPTTGEIVCNNDGTFTYTPLPEFAYIPAVVTYTITDEFGATATGTLTIKIQNTAPDIVDDTETTKAGVPVDVAVLANDSDPNLDVLRTFSAGGVLPPANGTLTINGDGTITYTPNPGWAGEDRFSYTAVEYFGDDVEGNPVFGSPMVAYVDITVVNDPPAPLPDEIDTPRFTPIAIAPLDNDSDPNPGQAVRLESFTQPPDGQGTVQRVGDTLVYTPPDDPDFFVGGAKSGEATFEVKVCDILPLSPDEELCTTTTVTVTVTNAAPIVTDQYLEVPSGTGDPLTVDVLGNALDPDDDPVYLRALGVPTVSGATVVIDGGGTADPSDDFAVLTPPSPEFKGPISFTFTVADSPGPTGGLESTATGTVMFQNQPPAPRPDLVEVLVNVQTEIDVLADNGFGADSDPNGDTLTVTPASGSSTLGDWSFAADGTLTYTPEPGASGVDTLFYEVCDGNPDTISNIDPEVVGSACATTSVTIRLVNRPPIAEPDAFTVPGGQPLTDMDVLADNGFGPDSDPNGDDTITFETVQDVSDKGGEITRDGLLGYTPPNGFAGTDTFTYSISDGVNPAVSATVTITVTNQPPEPGADAAVATPRFTPVDLDVVANDTDPNGTDVAIATSTDFGASPPAITIGRGKRRGGRREAALHRRRSDVHRRRDDHLLGLRRAA